MCGIVGAVAERDVVPLLVEGLRRLEYRGYDSAGLALIEDGGTIVRQRTVGRVEALSTALSERPLHGHTGIAHTRWATHGKPHENNAHPHLSETIAVVHNGIIENHANLRSQLESAGYRFESQTDTEVIAHRIHQHRAAAGSLHEAVRRTVAELDGAFALAVIESDEPDRIVMARKGCPVVVGIGIGEHFVASDIAALLPVTRRFVFLEEGDLAEVTRTGYTVFAADGRPATRPEHESDLTADAVERGQYRHYMRKEIFEQPRAVAETLEERMTADHVLDAAFGYRADALLPRVRNIHMVACGTSFHAALIARYQIERLAGIPVGVEIASEYRYRTAVVPRDSLFVSISQSGETADTLAALRAARATDRYLATLALCNVPESSLVRESDMTLMTRAGPEIGVASTKAFTTQLAGLALLALALRRHAADDGGCAAEIAALNALPAQIERVLELDGEIRDLAEFFVERHHALFLGRGLHWPVAMEGALKLKEITYIHAEAYAAGELKHGPLALVDDQMPVVAVAPDDALAGKLASNLEEVRARGGRLIVFAGPESTRAFANDVRVITLPVSGGLLADPVLYTIPLQLLAYHVAVLKGTDVDKPRNLAKSVTVE